VHLYRGRRDMAGYALSMAGAYLGGHFINKEKIGVNHAPQKLPSKFLPMIVEKDLPDGRMCKLMAGGMPVMLVKCGGRVFALAETCSHLGGPFFRRGSSMAKV
jgi:hypothetical protein